MRLTKNNPTLVCDRQHYACPSYHRWDGERVASWIAASLGFLIATLVVTLLAFLILGNPFESQQVKLANIQHQEQKDAAQVQESKSFAAQCAKLGEYVDQADDLNFRSCKRS